MGASVAMRRSRIAFAPIMATRGELPVVEAEDQNEWHRWLAANHDRIAGAWLKLAKQGSPTKTLSHSEAIEEALCFGWVDGQVRRFDEHFYLIRFTPRRQRSKWSQLNREKVERLLDEGRMQPSGMAQVEAAKADGRWDAA